MRKLAGFLLHKTDKATFGNTWRVVLAENEERLFRRVSWLVFAGLCVSGPALAQKEPSVYPAKAVTLINPFPPGGSVDTMARLLAQKLIDKWRRVIQQAGIPVGSI